LRFISCLLNEDDDDDDDLDPIYVKFVGQWHRLNFTVRVKARLRGRSYYARILADTREYGHSRVSVVIELIQN